MWYCTPQGSGIISATHPEPGDDMPIPPGRPDPAPPNKGTLSAGTTPDGFGGSEVPLLDPFGHSGEGTPYTSPLGPPQQADEIGRVGRYRVLRELGRGGMGIVYVAEDTQLRRKVAVKCLLPEVASRPGNRERFEREARATAAVEHENVIAIHDVGQERGLPFLVMPLLLGETLGDRFRREGRLPLPEVLRVGREMARGLDALHVGGLVHRDLKPGNVWVEAGTGRVKILDFGLARPGDGSDAVSLSGQVMGTPGYMAPEQVTGDKLDHRADLFSLGCILYEAATGRPACDGSNVLALLANLALQRPAPPESLNPEISPELSSLIQSLIEKHPDNRPPDARDVIDRFDRISPSPTAPGPLVPPRPRDPSGTADSSAVTVPSGVHYRTKPGPPTEPDPTPGSSGNGGTAPRVLPVWIWAALGGVAIVLVIGAILFVNRNGSGVPTKHTVSTATSHGDGTANTSILPREEVTRQPKEPTPEEKAERDYEEAIRLSATNPSDSARLFRAAADQGHPAAQYRLAMLLLHGTGVTDRASATSWLRRAAERGYSPAQAALGDYLVRRGESPESIKEARGLFTRALPELSRESGEGDVEARYALGLLHACPSGGAYDPRLAAKLYGQAAETGHANSQFRLGRCYDYAAGVRYDPVEAIRWYSAAADRGNALASATLGLLQCDGWGCPRDESKGLARINQVAADVRSLAEVGDPDAEVLLGVMASDGRGVPRDDAEAARWFKRAAERGDLVASNRLAGCYASGVGVTKNEKEAVRLYRAAADRPFPVAQYNLGDAYDRGVGVERDAAEAARWYDRAAEAGLPHAQLALGLLHDRGRGVPSDEATATKWYTRAVAAYRHSAQAGDVGAQFRLGQIYERGLGVPKDNETAADWYRKAADQGHTRAKEALGKLK